MLSNVATILTNRKYRRSIMTFSTAESPNSNFQFYEQDLFQRAERERDDLQWCFDAFACEFFSNVYALKGCRTFKTI